MNIGIPISRVPPSGRATTAPPSRAIVRDMERTARGKEIAFGRGLQQLGAGVGAIGEELHKQLVGDQILTSGIEYETGMQKFLVDVDNTKWVEDGIPQWHKILEQGNTKHKELIEGISKHLVPEAKEAFLLYAQPRKVVFDKILDNKIQGIRGNYTTKTFPLAMMRFARSGDIEASNNFLTQLKKDYFPESEWQELDKAFDTSVILGAIGNRLPDEQIERMIKEADSLTQQEKTSLRNSAKAAIANRQREQQAALAAKQDETANKMLLKLWSNELTESEIAQALDPDNKWITATRAKSLRASLLDPKIPKTDYLKAYENVNEAISDFRENRKTKEETLDVLYENLKDISREDGEQLLNRIYEIAKPDSALNRSDAKRAFTVLEELKDIRVGILKAAMKDDPTITSDTLREELLKQNQIKNDLEQWILDEGRTTEEIEKKVELMTSPTATDVVLTWFERLMWAKGQKQFLGLVGTEEERLAKKIKKTQIGGLPELKGFTTEEEKEQKALPPLPPREFYESHPETVPKGIKAYRDAGREPPDWMSKLAGKEGDTKLLSAPAAEFEDIWPDLDDDVKKKIWQAFENGYSPSEILSALGTK